MSSDIIKTALFLGTFLLVIIEADQIFKLHQQNCFVVGKSLHRDNRGSANVEVTSSNCFIFAKMSVRDNRGRSNFQITSAKLLYIWEKFTS